MVESSAPVTLRTCSVVMGETIQRLRDSEATTGRANAIVNARRPCSASSSCQMDTPRVTEHAA